MIEYKAIDLLDILHNLLFHRAQLYPRDGGPVVKGVTGISVGSYHDSWAECVCSHSMRVAQIHVFIARTNDYLV